MRIYDKLNKPLDFCTDCAPTEFEADEWYEDHNGYDCEHPPYDDGVAYYCDCCRAVLTSDDD